MRQGRSWTPCDDEEMCGIAGMLDLVPGLPSSERLVAEMTDSLLHRGPDDAGLFVDPPVTLGHRRLSILDLSPAGHEPMATDDRRFWITYNGEIYNYIELGRELRARGHTFRSACDTEVLLHAYAEWGPDALRRLNGMFAFAIWDVHERRLFCARDRFGVKPFYYTVAGNRFRFASEIKAVLLDPDVPRAPNEARFADFLVNALGDHTGETMFKGILQLRPGFHLTVSPVEGVGRSLRWYEPRPADLTGVRPDDAVRERLLDSVHLRLRSDVPVGTCLSGGIDSSSVVSIASRFRTADGVGPPESFSSSCADPKLDEGRYIDQVVLATGSRNHKTLPTVDDVIAHLDAVLWHMDEPFHAASVFAQWKVMRLARTAGVTVLLDGQGGDEVFAGYHYMYPSYFHSLGRAGALSALVGETRWRTKLHGVPARQTAVDVLKLAAPKGLRGRRVPAWIGSDLEIQPRPRPGRTLHEQQLYGLTVWPLPFYLHHEDRNSMSVAIEARVPFLDYRVVETGLALPPRDLIRHGLTKWALREAMKDIVPPSILGRPDKQGFPTDESVWLRDRLGNVLEETFRSSRMRQRGYFDCGELLTRLAEHRHGADHADELWRAFCAERWLRLFIDAPRLTPRRFRGAPTSTVRAIESRSAIETGRALPA